MATVKPQKIRDSLPQHPKRNDDSKKTTIGASRGTIASGQPHLASHAVGSKRMNKKAY